MSNQENMKTDIWSLAIIKDLDGLPGKNICKIFQTMQKIEPFKYVILNDINGAGITNLTEIENKLTVLEDIITDIEKVVQFDWGDFFLFKEVPQLWKSEEKSYDKLIPKTGTTVRAVDDTYIYVYTPYCDIVEALKQSYDIEEIKSGSLDLLDYPY
jgi:hypothetical protein